MVHGWLDTVRGRKLGVQSICTGQIFNSLLKGNYCNPVGSKDGSGSGAQKENSVYLF